jgi:nickel-dependent lactate racemase
MTATIEIRYGSTLTTLTVPAANLLDNVGMSEVQPAEDPLQLLAAALAGPIGCAPVREMARGKARVVLLVDDLTRPTPTHLLLPTIAAELAAAGVRDDQICILVATGTHRPMTGRELEQKLGSGAVKRFQVVNHDYRVAEDQVELGATPSGIPITINRLVAEADFVVGIGNIVPHRYCGWAGGAKIIQPGVGGEATTAGTHLMITKDPGARLGVVENQVRQEMEEVAERANLKFIVNTILDRNANVVDIVAGDFRLAFREGVARALGVYSVPLKGQADIVVASAYPSDINFWQAGKALYSADLVVREGGTIILASPCYEGVGEHGEFVDLLQYDYHTLDRMIAADQVHDRVGAAAALAVALVLGRAELWLVTHHVSEEEARRMNARRFTDLQAALDAALQTHGPDAKVTVLHEATELLPLVTESTREW